MEETAVHLDSKGEVNALEVHLPESRYGGMEPMGIQGVRGGSVKDDPEMGMHEHRGRPQRLADGLEGGFLPCPPDP